jgi:NIPSNAP
MIYEMRVYEAATGRLPDVNKRFNDHTTKLFEKHAIKNVGYWTTDVGESNHELTYIVAFKDANQRMDAWKNFRADPEWQRVVTESHRNGVIVAKVRNQILIPTPYSPMQ